MNQKALRALLATVKTNVDAVAANATTDDAKERSTALGSAWTALETHLGVGAAPDLIPCPSCKAEIMRVATICGHCWTRLPGHQLPA